MRADEIAMKAAHLISGDREKTHGEKSRNLANIARLWNAWLEIRFGVSGLSGADVAKLMGLLKIARMESGQFNLDDAIDGCGYIAIAGELDAPVITRR